MSIAVVIPSRLAPNSSSAPVAADRALYLDRALASVQAQTRRDLISQVVVCVDPGRSREVPARIALTSFGGLAVEVIEGDTASQASALNAGIRSVTAGWIAFLEDDDVWRPERIETQWEYAGKHDLVTSSQEEVGENGAHVRIQHFPTPSGWLLRADGRDSPRFDESFVWHVDTEMLGQLKRANARRVHFAPAEHVGNGLAWVACSSSIARNAGAPLVIRTLNTLGGMAQISRSARAARQSRLEYQEIRRRYGDLFPATGGVPW
ncbi:MAG: glycosyltransferase family A protein [Betaproteobacteria bacterium]